MAHGQSHRITPLQSAVCAVLSGNADVDEVRALLPYHDVNERDDSGRTALHLAARHGLEAILRVLLEAGANCDLQGSDGRTALHVAAAWGKRDIVDVLLQAGATCDLQDSDGRTALHLAAGRGHEDTAGLLLQAGADPLRRDRYGADALSYAARGGSLGLIRALWEHTVERAVTRQDLLRQWDARGQPFPPLCVAAQRGHLEAVELLLELGRLAAGL